MEAARDVTKDLASPNSRMEGPLIPGRRGNCQGRATMAILEGKKVPDGVTNVHLCILELGVALCDMSYI
jgi:hypothetical protein